MAARRRKGRKTVRRAKPTTRKRARRAKPSSRPRAKPSPSKVQPLRKPRSSAATDHRLVAGAALEVGIVLHYYPRAGAAVVSLSRPIHRGDHIHLRGHTTDFVQAVGRLALDGSAVSAATPPQQVGVQLEQRARPGDRVFRVSW